MELPTYNLGDLSPVDIRAYLDEKDVVMVPIASVRSNSSKRVRIFSRAGNDESCAIVCSCCASTHVRKAGVSSSIQR